MPNKEYLFTSTKKGKIGDDGKLLDSHMGDENYLTWKKTWDYFDMKDIGDYQNHYLKKRCFVISRLFQKIYWHMLKILWFLSLPII